MVREGRRLAALAKGEGATAVARGAIKTADRVAAIVGMQRPHRKPEFAGGLDLKPGEVEEVFGLGLSHRGEAYEGVHAATP